MINGNCLTLDCIKSSLYYSPKEEYCCRSDIFVRKVSKLRIERHGRTCHNF